MPPNIQHGAAGTFHSEHDTAGHPKTDVHQSNDLLSPWATVDLDRMGVDATPYAVSNLVNGAWTTLDNTMTIIHPLDESAPPLFTIPDTSVDDLPPYLASLGPVPKSGLHNPLKNPERYVMLGEVSRKAAGLLATPEVAEYFTNLITTCVPKSHGTSWQNTRSTVFALAPLRDSTIEFASSRAPINRFSLSYVSFIQLSRLQPRPWARSR